MKTSQSNFDLRAPSSYLARSYLIATVLKIRCEEWFSKSSFIETENQDQEASLCFDKM